MTADEFKAELADIAETAKHAADPREPAARLAAAMLARIETPAPAPAPDVTGA